MPQNCKVAHMHVGDGAEALSAYRRAKAIHFDRFYGIGAQFFARIRCVFGKLQL